MDGPCPSRHFIRHTVSSSVLSSSHKSPGVMEAIPFPIPFPVPFPTVPLRARSSIAYTKISACASMVASSFLYSAIGAAAAAASPGLMSLEACAGIQAPGGSGGGRSTLPRLFGIMCIIVWYHLMQRRTAHVSILFTRSLVHSDHSD